MKNMKTLALSLFLLLPSVSSAADNEVSTRKVVDDNPKQEYFLIDNSEGREPEGGYKLLLVLPGGNGSADFNPFVTNIGKHAAGADYLVAQLIAVNWTPEQKVTWPTEVNKVKGAKFSTEEFLAAVISDIKKSHKVNPEHVYTLSWSSGGPAAYAASLEVDDIKGSFVAMSVFKPKELPRLSKAKGHRYYIYHSPEDKICPLRMAEEAKERLSDEGADVEFITYEGGHGWHGNIFGALRTGFSWLAKR
jgi:predicted esterase